MRPIIQMEDWRVRVGNNVRKLRQARGLSQEKVALEAQIDLTYLGGIERGRRNPSLMVMVRIAEALDADVVALLA
ncbi:MAG: helix-turn-helix domain-containing protein [Sphingomonadaceae bacterium]